MKIINGSPLDIGIISHIIKEANIPIANRFNITPINGPAHPSNCKDEWIKGNMNKGTIYFLYYIDLAPVGVVGIDKKSDLISIKHLAVLPSYWRNGIGRQLIEYVITLGRLEGFKYLNLGLIGSNIELMEWYKSIGFVKKREKKIKNLPYTITFMRMTL